MFSYILTTSQWCNVRYYRHFFTFRIGQCIRWRLQVRICQIDGRYISK